jgi:hypothetical protein
MRACRPASPWCSSTLLNTSWSDQVYARKALIKFLGQIEPQDRIAIFALGKRSLTLLHDYTTDPPRCIDRLKKDRVKSRRTSTRPR